MWSHFDPAEIELIADLQQLGANTVRISIDPFQFGWPNVTSPWPLSQTSLVPGQCAGLHVELTLFDWWSSYCGDPQQRVLAVVALGGLRRTIPQECLSSCRTRSTLPMPRPWPGPGRYPAGARSVVGDIPLTFSISSSAGLNGIRALQAALGGEPISFYDIHYYGSAGSGGLVPRCRPSCGCAAPLFVGEVGLSTYATAGAGEQASLESCQASFYAGVEAARHRWGCPRRRPSCWTT